MNTFVVIDSCGVEHQTNDWRLAKELIEFFTSKSRIRPTCHIGSTLVFDTREELEAA